MITTKNATQEANEGKLLIINTKTHKRFYTDEKHLNDLFSRAKIIVAQDYKYIRCTRKALSDAFTIAGGSKAQVFKWMLNHTSHSKNVIPYSQRALAKKIGVGYSTVKRVINKLRSKDLAKTRLGCIVISPRLFFYGSDNMFIANLKKFNNM